MRKLIIATVFILFSGVAFGQALQKGGVVGYHEWTIKLNPGVTADQFLEIWDSKGVPVMKNAIPEQTPFLLKGISADNKDKYASIYYFNSFEDLRKYWNEDGTPTEKGTAAMVSYGPLFEELSKLGEFTYTAKDWIIIR